MSRPKTKSKRINVQCTATTKEQLDRKLIAIGCVYNRSGNVEAGYAQFIELLADKPLDWFQKNFSKPLDTL